MAGQPPLPAARVVLRDVAASAGVRFTYDQSPTSEKHYIESAPGGLAVFDNDGAPDIHLTALTGETFPLFKNDGHGVFTETTQSTGLGALTVKRGGWCTVFADLDNDGWKDLFTANSHANDRIGEFQTTAWKQANAVFLNEGGRHFREASEEAGLARAVAVHRGCGVADVDADGRLDLVVVALGSPAEVWHNESRRVTGSGSG